MSDASQFNNDDTEILIEIMNMGFGAACAELADALNSFITITVPKVFIGTGDEVTEFANKNIASNQEVSIVEQGFWGNWNGTAYLAIPSELVAEMLNIMGFDEEKRSAEELSDEERTMVFAQVSSLLINSCINKISGIFNEENTFSAPHILLDKVDGFTDEVFPEDAEAIIAEAQFSLDNDTVCGSLFITYNEDSFNWLRTSIDTFTTENL
ncbi:MAG: chemotaxis protein CheC [Fibrobacterales bacterium]